MSNQSEKSNKDIKRSKNEQGDSSSNSGNMRKSRIYLTRTGFGLLYLLLTASTGLLYYRQAVRYQGPIGTYDSDLPAHISEGVNHTAYSLMERSFGFLKELFHSYGNYAIALWLALLTSVTVYLIYRVLRCRYPEANPILLHLSSFACIFVTSIYIPSLNPCPYLGTQTGSIWHNSTYIGMRTAGTLVILLYDRYQETYRDGMKLRQWVLFTVSLILVNLMKPNFLLAFAPAMAVLLLADCIADRGKTLKQQILFGIPVLISLAVIVYEFTVLFRGENSGSSVVFGQPYGLFHWNHHPYLALVQSAAFPLVMLAGSLKDLKHDRKYRAAWLIWLIGLLEYLNLTETGVRATHGNLSWGYSFCMFLIFAVCSGRLWSELREYAERYRTEYRKAGSIGKAARIGKAAVLTVRGMTAGQMLRLLYLCLAGLVFLWHLKCGLQFARMLWMGGSYLAGAF